MLHNFGSAVRHILKRIVVTVHKALHGVVHALPLELRITPGAQSRRSICVPAGWHARLYTAGNSVRASTTVKDALLDAW